MQIVQDTNTSTLSNDIYIYIYISNEIMIPSKENLLYQDRRKVVPTT